MAALRHELAECEPMVRRLCVQLGRLVSESACERKDPGSDPAADMVDAARNTAWDLGIKPNNYRSNYPTQEWARRIFSGFTMESPTGFSTITWPQRNPNLDSGEHSIFHKQKCMTNKEPRPQSFELFYLVHFGEKGLSYLSHYSRVPQSKTEKEMGNNSTKTDTYRLRCICK
ncbi:hypothetical protein FHG87_006497 [Trinorchestia longiramus]|nr:hypothetical protein FHG87_006497 [Trinorchestia longiramus]